jgi:hypothetical protein
MNLLSFADLHARGIVSNWPQLRRLIANYNFPAGFLLSANSRRWTEEEVEAWLSARRSLQAPSTADAVAA